MSDIPCNNCGVRFSEHQALKALLDKAKPILNHVARYRSTGFNDQKIAQEILKGLEE